MRDAIPGVVVRRLERKTDPRGWLLKILMQRDLTTKREFGEIYLTMANPGQVKGQHYHRRTSEWFHVVIGTGRLVLETPDGRQRQEVVLSGDDPVIVYVPPMIAHAVQNVGDDEMILMAYADREYDSFDPDTVPLRMSL